ncbi:MAG TPA: phage tail sheath subtilisin-like domain-containing protein [Actinomycetes bacterium]|nr:phage tail sheath subtilisin-like domain-containing protein [Actinomycetes bacterium]
MPNYLAPGVYVEEVPAAVKPIAGVGTSTAGFIGISANITRAWDPAKKTGMPAGPTGDAYTQAPAQRAQLITSWTEFTQKFGEIQESNQYLAHAVYGFFNNGGTQCWVTRLAAVGDLAENLDNVLEEFEAKDEIAIVAAPLPPTLDAAALNAVHAALVAHCERTSDRVAVLDSTRDIADGNLVLSADATGIWRPSNPKGYGAFYFPWVEVADPLGDVGARLAVPPSGHVAGIYARSDAQRGVHKAPANEIVLGALGTHYPVSKSRQDLLNPVGVNCIRAFGGTIKVYGARTLASDPQGDPEWTYVNVRRLVNFLRESIDEGTQWVVFEPNASELWSKIRRNVGAFLTTQWTAGALLGNTPEQAFYVRCDETTNPQEVRDLGRVVTEVGVAIVKPAEFVIFRLSQWAGAAQ